MHRVFERWISKLAEALFHRPRLAAAVFQQLFLPAPSIHLTATDVEAFEGLWRSITTQRSLSILDYRLPLPKYAFLHYLVTHKGVVLHGTSDPTIECFQARASTDWRGEAVTGVFATKDSIWPLFFAINTRARQAGSIRNACFVVGDTAASQRYYFFSVSEACLPHAPWQSGAIYLLPADDFHPTDQRPVHFDEWMSGVSVTPIAMLPVTPADFPFLSAVTGHSEAESIYTSWWLSKRRQRHR